MQGIRTVILGTAGASLIEGTQNIDFSIDPSTNGIVGLVLQVVIGLVTLFKLFKKKSPSTIKKD